MSGLTDRVDLFRGVVLGVATGNALGLRAEGLTARQLADRFPGGVRDIPPEERTLPWDDDLAQTVLLAEAILEKERLDVEDLAGRLLRWRRENGRGIGFLTANVIREIEGGTPASDAAFVVWHRYGRNAAGNGAIMRCAPIAMRWWSDPMIRLTEAIASATVTHWDPRCVWSTVAMVEILSALVIGNANLPALRTWLDDQGAPAEVAEAIEAGNTRTLEDFELDEEASMGYTMKALEVAVWSLSQDRDFEEVLIDVINAGGDTDTNGAVVGAVMGARTGSSGIPESWLENIPRADHLIRLADRLFDASTTS